MERITNQKQIILDYIQSVKTHPTAEEVYIAVRKKLPRISLGTVYRNLEKFAKNGIILEIKGEIKRFDGDISEHQHFICNQCENVFDIFEDKTILNKNILKKIDKIGKAKKYDFYIYGICKKCQKNNKLNTVDIKNKKFRNINKQFRTMPCKKKKATPKKSAPKRKCGTRKCSSKKK